MALPIIRAAALRLAPRLDAATLEKSDVEVMRAAIRASDAPNDAASKLRGERLDALGPENPQAETYIRHRFAYALAFLAPKSGTGDRLDALDPSERAAIFNVGRADGAVMRTTVPERLG
jgi:hypothetical protein